MRECTNVACGMKGQRVDTERSTCAGCGRPLGNPFGDLFDGLFGKTGSSPTVPAEVLTALREATSLLESFDAGVPVKRKMIQHTLAKCRSALGRFG